MDKVIVRLLATLQILVSGICFLTVVVALNYGGATRNPGALPLAFLYCGYGVVSGIFLFSLHIMTRIFAAVWHAILVTLTFLAVNPANSRESVGGGFTLIFGLSLVSAFYLVLSAWVLRRNQPNPKATVPAVE
jgi:hypothetical protein